MCGRLLGHEERALFDKEVRKQEKERKKQAKQQAAQNQYYEQGFQAGFLPNGYNLLPTRASHNSRAAWERGYNNGKAQCDNERLIKATTCKFSSLCPQTDCPKSIAQIQARFAQMKAIVREC
jgi:hypothetical protein